MAGFVDKRKRSREDDCCCEWTPLSKRINNLHLSNCEEHSSSSSSEQQPIQQQRNNNECYPLDGQTSDYNTDSSSSSAIEHLYNPELDEFQNPYYYSNNKLLHELHLERLKRFNI